MQILGKFMFQSRNRGSFDFKSGKFHAGTWTSRRFQSRNRGSFDFKFTSANAPRRWTSFQSRNRGSFDFKPTLNLICVYYSISFNLVIEVLLISRFTVDWTPLYPASFNLVIEVLLISRALDDLLHTYDDAGFNLVIEVLLISSPVHRFGFKDVCLFQSRNRGSFDFKDIDRYWDTFIDLMFQSRNRGSFDFK